MLLVQALYMYYESKCTETDLKKSQICPILGQSNPIWGQPWPPCLIKNIEINGKFWSNLIFSVCCDSSHRYERVAGFYKGLVPSLLRVTPACAITFVTYESIITAFKTEKNNNSSSTAALSDKNNSITKSEIHEESKNNQQTDSMSKSSWPAQISPMCCDF